MKSPQRGLLDLKNCRLHRRPPAATTPCLGKVPIKSGRRDSNPRRPAWEASTLPLSYSRMVVKQPHSPTLPPSTVVYRSRRPIRKQTSSLARENRLHCNDPSNCNVWKAFKGSGHLEVAPIWVLPSRAVSRYDSRPFALMPWRNRGLRPG